MDIPTEFARRIQDVYRDQGQAWLDRLPDIIRDLEGRWRFRVGPPFANLTYNYVAPATTADGSQAVLKLGVPNPELRSEGAALRLADGRGYARLLAHDDEIVALLLERVRPGTPLRDLKDDDEATRIAARIMRRTWRPVPEGHSFPAVGDWARGMERLPAAFDGGTGPFAVELVEEAEQLFSQLLSTMAAPVVLHGDLHHWNILQAEREPWLAIDPKGVVGEPVYEVGALLRNPFPDILGWPDPQALFKRRLGILAEELGFDRKRMRDWAIAQGVLSAWWGYEDHGPDERFAAWLGVVKAQSEVRF